MTDQATGAAPAAPQTPIASIKAFLSSQAPSDSNGKPIESAPKDEAENSGVAPPASSQALPETEGAEVPDKPATREDAEEAETESEDEPTEDDAADAEVQLSTVKELAEATGLDLDKIMDLAIPTKIDGKEGTARLRDLVRSYQLDGHINQKLATLDNDRKVFETKRGEVERVALERLQSLDSGVEILERALTNEFQGVDWTRLQNESPAQFNALYVKYQQRFGEMQQIANQIAAEKQSQQQARQAQAKAWLEEQSTLLKAKVPEWSDDTKRAQDKAAQLEYLKGHGITQEEFEQLADHRYALVIRDAWKWGALQKQRAPILKKVKAAPKLLKPGKSESRESRETVAAKGDMDRLRASGRVGDAAKVIKRQIFGARK